MNLTEITQAFVDLISEVPNARPYVGMQESVLSSSATGTAILVHPGEPYIVDYYRAMAGGLAEVNFVLEIVVPRTSMRDAQVRINDFLSSGDGETLSLIDALRPNDLPQTMGDLICDFRFGDVSGISERNIGEVQYIGCDIDITVFARRTLTP